MSAKARPSHASSDPPQEVRNTLLAALPAADRDRIVSSLDVVPLKLKEFLQKSGEPARFVYFPRGGFLSVVIVLEDGSMIEVATIGREGMVGVTATSGDIPLPAACLVQGAHDGCYRMTIDTFQTEMDRRGPFHDLVTRYTQALIGFIMQSTACNALHSVEQRLARWLLMAHDRMESDEFPLTQEFVAMMLGANRPTVTVVAGTLQRAALITYRRGRITILDREKLVSASCECYGTATKLLKAVTSSKDGRSSR